MNELQQDYYAACRELHVLAKTIRETNHVDPEDVAMIAQTLSVLCGYLGWQQCDAED